jgi:hypothetical protein
MRVCRLRNPARGSTFGHRAAPEARRRWRGSVFLSEPRGKVPALPSQLQRFAIVLAVKGKATTAHAPLTAARDCKENLFQLWEGSALESSATIVSNARRS